ncbi:N-acetylmuramoyl-L-alanine amidase [Metallumcola ferriviriculae]|uniref:N-acetylmuramoyl-L-alanine amidase n=1 Tax=Metallumcola ferriviriculae TaxID=3039180 RepID=A0AAU0UKG0_9FIRM|nr:N-acetylmuramoyl-L-alanine amidase [Desulfitibacteraceae bacterium MK1]
MELITKYMTRNDCYKAGRKINPTGIMVHSTATPGMMAVDWFSRWNKSYQAGEINRQVCVHAFLDDKEVHQYLPWEHRGWHAGGKANNTHIGFEICEPGGFSYAGGANMVGYDVLKQEAYFRKAWQNAVELCVMLCKKYGLSEQDIVDHSEGHKLAIASNHADVKHWFPKHGESMDTFRKAVKVALKAEQSANSNDPIAKAKKLYRVQVGAFANKQNADAMLEKIKAAGFDGYVKYE